MQRKKAGKPSPTSVRGAQKPRAASPGSARPRAASQLPPEGDLASHLDLVATIGLLHSLFSSQH